MDIDDKPSNARSRQSWFGPRTTSEIKTDITAAQPIDTPTKSKIMVSDTPTPPLSSSAGSVNSWFRLRGRTSKPDIATIALHSNTSTLSLDIDTETQGAKRKSQSQSTDSHSVDAVPDSSFQDDLLPRPDVAIPAIAPTNGWFSFRASPRQQKVRIVPKETLSLPSSPKVGPTPTEDPETDMIIDQNNVQGPSIESILSEEKDESTDPISVPSQIDTSSTSTWWTYLVGSTVRSTYSQSTYTQETSSYTSWSWFGSWRGSVPSSDTFTTNSDPINDAQDTSSQPTTSCPSSPILPVYNPISSSVKRNRSSWASFFTSNSTMLPDTRKKLTEEGNSNSMEVMVIPSADEIIGIKKPEPVRLSPKVDNKLRGTKKVTSGNSPAKMDKDIVKTSSSTTLIDRKANQVGKTADRPNGIVPSQSTPTNSPGKPASTSASPSMVVPKATSSQKKSPAPKDAPPNIVLPAFEDVFGNPKVHRASNSLMSKTMSVVNFFLNPMAVPHAPTSIPKALETPLIKVKKAVIIGIHGWFPGTIIRSVFGAPTGTSSKFRDMMVDALQSYLTKHGLTSTEIVPIALEGEGKVDDRVNMHYTSLLNRPDWMTAIKEANVLLFAAHSQGSIVATHLIARLIEQRHVHPERGQRICAMMMCGIHHGPFTYLNGNVVVKYLEANQARELFEFQDSDSRVHKRYVQSWRLIIRSGVKLVYVASLADNVVPIYSAIFDAATHPSILRALFIDGTTYNKDDFITNLIVFCLKLRNAGLSDHGLLVHLSDILVGSIYGDGHSLIYFDSQVYQLAVKYLFETTPLMASDEPIDDNADGKPGTSSQYQQNPFSADPISPIGGTYSSVTTFPSLSKSMPNSFRAPSSSNPYYLPWAMRGVFEDPIIRSKFSQDLNHLRKLFEEWNPQTKPLKDIRYRLEPLRRDIHNHQRQPSHKKASL